MNPFEPLLCAVKLRNIPISWYRPSAYHDRQLDAHGAVSSPGDLTSTSTVHGVIRAASNVDGPQM
jgi:hypothetical protein